MHRGRNRSRKPVESQSASQSLSIAVSHATTVSSTGSGNRSYQGGGLGSGSFQNSHLYPTASSGNFDFGSNVSKLQVNANTYGINNSSYRYLFFMLSQYQFVECLMCKLHANSILGIWKSYLFFIFVDVGYLESMLFANMETFVLYTMNSRTNIV